MLAIAGQVLIATALFLARENWNEGGGGGSSWAISEGESHDSHDAHHVVKNQQAFSLDPLGLFHKPFPKLPQNANAAEKLKRKVELGIEQFRYQYKYDTNIKGAPFLVNKTDLTHQLNIIPINELPSPNWIRQVRNVLLELLGAAAVQQIDQILLGDPKKALEIFALILPEPLGPGRFYDRPTSIKDYEIVFDQSALPQSSYEYELDEAFVRWRLAGPNPMMMKPCTKELLDQYANLDSVDQRTQQRIQTALDERRLFACEYSILELLPSGNNDGYQKYNVVPFALFEMPNDLQKRERQSLEPIGIQCYIKSKLYPNPPMFTPDDGVKWTIAKACVGSADGDFHEAIVHLGRTHLVMESFVVGTHRTLPTEHPLNYLLMPHFVGTAFINQAADQRLISPKGLVDRLVNPEITQLTTATGAEVINFMSSDFSFPTMLKNRNMDNDTFPAPFQYRDDGMLVWNALRDWVEDYLRIYYGDESTAESRIQNDFELQNWIREMADEKGGKVGWLKSFDGTLEMLTNVLSAVIFTGTAQHAAVNFPQKELESWVPAYPLALYQEPPKTKGELTKYQDYLDMLPPMQMAFVQRKVAYLLGGVQINQLGIYDSDQFVDPLVRAPLQKFQRALEDIEAEIQRRNVRRVAAWDGTKLTEQQANNWAYQYLLPSKIPNSINI